MELGVPAQLEHHGHAVLGDLPALGELGFELGVVVAHAAVGELLLAVGHQAVVDEPGDAVGRAIGADPVDVEGLADDAARGHPRVEARVRVLEDHLEAPAHAAQVRPFELGHLDPVEDDRAAGGRVEADDRPSGTLHET